jgi:hypothetical protein
VASDPFGGSARLYTSGSLSCPLILLTLFWLELRLSPK